MARNPSGQFLLIAVTMDIRQNARDNARAKTMTVGQALGVLEYGLKWGCGRNKVAVIEMTVAEIYYN